MPGNGKPLRPSNIWAVRVLPTHGEPVWLRKLWGGNSLEIFKKATVVNLGETKITDRDLAYLENLHGLERLNLNQTKITDKGLNHLAGLSGLKALDLSGTQIGGRGLEQLRGLTDLEYLYLSGTKTNDGDLKAMFHLPNLRELDLTATEVTPQGVREIQRHIPHLKVSR